MISDALAGIVAGSGYAILGLSIVFLYRLARVVNVAAPALGAVGVFVMAALCTAGMPVALAIGIGVFVGASLSVVMGIGVATGYDTASDSIKTGVAIAVLVGMVTLGSRVTGQVPHRFPELLPSTAFVVAGITVTWATVVVLALGVVLVGSLWLFLEKTSLGLYVRAAAEAPIVAEGLGIDTRKMALISWAAAGALSTVAMILIAGSSSPDFVSLSLLIVPALAAAVTGALRSFSKAFAGGMLLGLTEGICSRFVFLGEYRNVIPFLMTISLLLWSERQARWNDAR